MRGLCYRAIKDFEAAISDLKKTLEIQKSGRFTGLSTVDCQIELLNLLLEIGKLDEAVNGKIVTIKTCYKILRFSGTTIFLCGQQFSKVLILRTHELRTLPGYRVFVRK